MAPSRVDDQNVMRVHDRLPVIRINRQPALQNIEQFDLLMKVFFLIDSPQHFDQHFLLLVRILHVVFLFPSRDMRPFVDMPECGFPSLCFPPAAAGET